RLEQAIGVVMGANIGTTITAQIIAFRMNRLALPAIMVGVVVLFVAKRQSLKYWAGCIIGFGILFLGLNIMAQEMGELRQSASVVALFQSLNCAPPPGGFIPLVQFLKAVGCGLLVTLILQSSSATVGLLIAVAGAGLVDPYAAFGILLGDNMGTTITAVLASIGATTAAKRSACFHVIFNVVGAVIMILMNYVSWPGKTGRPIFMELVNQLTAGDVFDGGENLPRFIANAHSLFNITCTILFISFISQFARLCRFIVKADSEGDKPGGFRRRLDSHLLSMPSLALQQVWVEVGVMLGKAREAQNEGYRALVSAPGQEWNERAREAKNLEKETDELKTAITNYLGGISLTVLNENQSEMFPHLVRTVNDAEKVADIGKHLSRLAKRLRKRSLTFSPEAIEDMTQMIALVNELLQLAERTVNINADGIEMSGGGAVLRKKLLDDGKRMEKLAKAKAVELRKNHERRQEAGGCDIKSEVVFLDVANSLARSAGCAVNIIEASCHTAVPQQQFMQRFQSTKIKMGSP
ncbi:MAG: Na/Pi cotransporter family protein, partial [Planctomycetes bacterium]|nr:Na/Pi cotransporter family protein [Planctomycetota bacterium]